MFLKEKLEEGGNKLDSQYVLQIENVSKEYDGNPVLKDVSLSAKAGKIRALVGENGAGKSTLMNILFGMQVIHSTGGYKGIVKIEGKEVNFQSPYDAMEAGIGRVHQEFMLIPGFTITENIKVGREITTPTMVSRFLGKKLEKLDHQAMEADAKKALSTIGMDIEQHVKVAGLPVGYMQFVEIAREIDKTNIKLLVFDEPTAVLTESEADRLLEVMRKIAQKGIAIIFITHRLTEVMDVADDITILRDGELVTSKSISEISVPEIAELMIGRKIDKLVDDTQKPDNLDKAPIALKVEKLKVNMPGEKVKNVDFEVHQGEIFGIGGLAGQGKIGIPNGIMGMFPAEGNVEIFGEKLQFDKIGDALQKGLAFVSEDRRNIGLLLDDSIEENVTFHAISVKSEYLTNLGIVKLINKKQIRKNTQDMIELFDIRCTGPQQAVGALSGGNQQKVCLSSALTLKPRVLIVSEPTRGIDIGAKKLIMEHLVKLRKEEEITIVIISSELIELRSICDRIAIVSDGVISKILSPEAPDVEFGLAMSATNVKEEKL